jgi:hypothetical protein
MYQPQSKQRCRVGELCRSFRATLLVYQQFVGSQPPRASKTSSKTSQILSVRKRFCVYGMGWASPSINLSKSCCASIAILVLLSAASLRNARSTNHRSALSTSNFTRLFSWPFTVLRVGDGERLPAAWADERFTVGVGCYKTGKIACGTRPRDPSGVSHWSSSCPVHGFVRDKQHGLSDNHWSSSSIVKPHD